MTGTSLKHLTISGEPVDNLLIRSCPRSRPDPFRSVRDLGRAPVGRPLRSGETGNRSSGWLPAWLPGRAAARALPAVFKSVRSHPAWQHGYLGFQWPHLPCHPRSSRVYPARSPVVVSSVKLVRWQADPDSRATRHEVQKRCSRATHYERVTCVAHGFKVRASFNFPRPPLVTIVGC